MEDKTEEKPLLQDVLFNAGYQAGWNEAIALWARHLPIPAGDEIMKLQKKSGYIIGAKNGT